MHTTPCRFCALIAEGSAVVDQTPHFIIVREPRPVSPGHLLIISKAHRTDIFDLTIPEGSDIIAALHCARNIIEMKHAPFGFNVGANCGEVAGQSQMHFHLHVIPRYPGDHPQPRGGVRNIFPGAPAPLA